MRLQPTVDLLDATVAYRINESIPASFTIWEDDNVSPTLYRAESNLEGVNDIANVNAATTINTAMAALPARTWLEKVSLKGDFDINTTLTIPDYCLFDAHAAKLTWTGADDLLSFMIENADKIGGNAHSFINGGVYDGGNKAGRVFDFVKLTYFSIQNTYQTNIKQMGAFNCVWASRHGVAVNNIIEGGNKGLGFNFFDGCSNIAVSNNVFNLLYDSAVSIGSVGGAAVLCYDITVTGNTAIGYPSGNGLGISVFGKVADITITANKISDMAFDGINSLQDVDIPNRIAVVGNIIRGCERNGINLDATNSVVSSNIVNDIINAGIGSGVWVAGDNMVVIGNNIQDCDKGIYVYPAVNNAVLTGNRCNSNAYGVDIGAGCNKTIVVGNNLLGNTTQNLQDNGTDTIADHNAT